MIMNNQQTNNESSFYQGEPVIWHCKENNRTIPIPGVVVRHEPDSILIKARYQGTIRELHVDPDQLVAR
jgi:ribosomal protein L35AE/L33A